jgi:pimeloyl-ACP methyl ester carboxylesterase
VALVTLRMFPDDVASAILDGVVPPQTDVFAPSEMHYSQQQALAQLVSDCNAEAACAAAYPQLADNLAQLAADTEDSVSVDFTDARGVARHADVSQQMVAHMLQYLIDDPSVNARIPQAATAAVAGDGGPLEPIVSEFARRRASADRQAQSFRSVDYDAVACSDFASGPPLGGREVCDALGVAYQPEMSTPVTSTRPVLLLSGAYDERTPPALADTAAQTLPNNYREVFPATGHGIYEFPQAAACAAQVVGSFLLKPTAQPDDQCLAQIQRPRWVI